MESTLSLQLSDLATEVGHYLGFGRTASNWTGWQAASPYVPSSKDSQLGWIMACIQAGLRQFYFPKPVDGGPVAHKWSFLTPQRTIALVASQGVYDLPDDFGSIEGELTYQPTDSTWLTVQRVGIGEVNRYLQTLFGITDKPTRCAIYPKPTDGAMGQRFAISFAPVPDSTYTLTYTCNLLPTALSATSPYPYGGAMHGETILESCLAVAESRFNDEMTTHRAAFTERLLASITVDIRDFKPAYFGYNGDSSDNRGFGPWGDPWNSWSTQTTGATYNGVQY